MLHRLQQVDHNRNKNPSPTMYVLSHFDQSGFEKVAELQLRDRGCSTLLHSFPFIIYREKPLQHMSEGTFMDDVK